MDRQEVCFVIFLSSQSSGAEFQAAGLQVQWKHLKKNLKDPHWKALIQIVSGGWNKTKSVSWHFFKDKQQRLTLGFFWKAHIERNSCNVSSNLNLAQPTTGTFGHDFQIFHKSRKQQTRWLKVLASRRTRCKTGACWRREWTAKVFPGHFEFYHFIPLSTQPCGMLIARRAGGASEITLQRWRLCYAQRASRFNARCPELWLIAPGCCCNTSSALVKPFEAQRARSLLWYTDLRCRGANVEGLLIFKKKNLFSHHKQEIVQPRLIFKISSSWKKKKRSSWMTYSGRVMMVIFSGGTHRPILPWVTPRQSMASAPQLKTSGKLWCPEGAQAHKKTHKNETKYQQSIIISYQILIHNITKKEMYYSDIRQTSLSCLDFTVLPGNMLAKPKMTLHVFNTPI